MVQKRSKNKNPLDDWKALGFKPESKNPTKRDWKVTLGASLFFTIGMILLVCFGVGLTFSIIKVVPNPFRWPLAMAMLLLPHLMKKKITVLKPFVSKAQRK